MGQTHLKRTHFEARSTVINPKNDDKQDVEHIKYFELGDKVDVIDEDANGNIISVLANNAEILAISPVNIPTKFIVLDTVVDTTLATGTPRIRVQEIDDGHEAIDRLYCRRPRGPIVFDLYQYIENSQINEPVAGQTTLDVDDASFWRVGDIADLLADEGIIVSDTTVLAVNPNADDSLNKATIVVSGNHDTSTFTNPFIINKTITDDRAIRRNQERIDGIDQPVENELMGIGNKTRCAWESQNLFVENSAKATIDGRRGRLGTQGTRATHTQDLGTNSELKFTSMLMGLLGNFIDVQVVNAPGLTVTVSELYKSSSTAIIPPTKYLVQVNSNNGTATAQEIADAINADSVAKTVVQVQYGGGGEGADGSGIVTPFGPTALAGGLDDGTGDYAEVEQIFQNSIIGTGFKWISQHMRPDERNRYNEPPHDDEEIVIDYRRAFDNVDR